MRRRAPLKGHFHDAASFVFAELRADVARAARAGAFAFARAVVVAIVAVAVGWSRGAWSFGRRRSFGVLGCRSTSAAAAGALGLSAGVRLWNGAIAFGVGSPRAPERRLGPRLFGKYGDPNHADVLG